MERRDSVEETDSSPDGGRWGRKSAGASSSSPDSKCPICLDAMDNRALASSCMHGFCFLCILEWAKNKPECPLCKQPFRSIIYNVRSNSSFDEYWLAPEDGGDFASPGAGGGGGGGRHARRRSPPARPRAERPPEEPGVLFEAAPLRRQAGPRVDAHIRQMQQQLRERRRARLNNRSLRRLKHDEVVAFRRALYRGGVRVRRVENGGRYRAVSPGFFAENPAALHRLVPWLKRELTVLFGPRESLVGLVLRRVLENVTRFQVDSAAFAQDLRPMLVHRTDHFLHEFASFARAPFNMEAYDERAFYDAAAPGVGDGADSSESSVIAISPDAAAGDRAGGPGGARALCVLKSPVTPASPASPSLPPGLSGWDDETPGPSYAGREEAAAAGRSPGTPDPTRWSGRAGAGTLGSSARSRESAGGDDDDDGNLTPLVAGAAAAVAAPARVSPDVAAGDSDSDECVIVGYVKPLAERTPELVTLSSDSEAEGEAAAGTSGVNAAAAAAAAAADAAAPKSRAPERRYPSPPSVSLCETEDSAGTHWLSDSSGGSRRRRPRGGRSDEEKPRRGASGGGDDAAAAPPRELSSRRDESSRSGSREPRSSRHGKQRRRPSREPSADGFKDWDRSESRSRRSRDGDERRDRERERGHHERSRSRERSRGRERARGRAWEHGREQAHGRHRDSEWSGESERSAYRVPLCEQSRAGDRRERSGHRDKARRRGPNAARAASERCRSRRSPAPRDRSRSAEWSRARDDREERHRGVGGRSSEKPGGKRKCKTHHIEHAYYLSYTSAGREHRREAASASHSPERYRGRYRNAEPPSAFAAQPRQQPEPAAGPSHHKAGAAAHGRGKRSRSSSVEIVFEGKLTIDAEHFRKSRRKRKKSKHKRRH